MVLFGPRRVSQAYPVVLALGCLAGLGWLALRRGVSAQVEAHSFPAALLALGVGVGWGALVAVGLYAGLRRLRLAPLADALALPALLVALSAWTGCLMEACVYGRPVPAALFAPPSADLFGVTVPRWPTAAVGTVARGLLVCGFLWVEGRAAAP